MEVAVLEEAILCHLVLVFREQSLTEEEQVRFSCYFGDPEPHVRTHPRTKRRATFVSPQFTRYIEGIPRDESDALVDALLRHVTRLELGWTHKWRPGDLVVWDNRCTMHRREPFAATERPAS